MNQITITSVTHSNHRHELGWIESGSPYICNGCEVFGCGPRYSCPRDTCNFNVHGECCETIPQNYVTIHPFLDTNSNFVLRHSSRTRTQRVITCKACSGHISAGSSYYHCSNTNRNLHFSCARLPSTITENINNRRRNMTLRNQYHTNCLSPRCPGVDGGWSYFSSDDECNLHVRCWKRREKKKLTPPDVSQLNIG